MELRHILEAAMLAAGRPLDLAAFAGLFGESERPDDETLLQALGEVERDYAARPLQLQRVASGYRLQVRADYSPWIGRLFEDRPGRYSRAFLETLAIIAYRQPVTRGEIEDIRGVAVSSGIIRGLLEREWIHAVGHKEVPGRPALFATTRRFLDYFNLTGLEDLPPMQDFLQQPEPELPAVAAAIPAAAQPPATADLPDTSDDANPQPEPTPS